MENQVAASIVEVVMHDICNEGSSDSSSSDEEQEFVLEMFEQGRKKIKKIDNYMVTVMRMDPDTYKSHFRLTRGSYEMIRNAIYPKFVSNNTHGGHPNISLDRALHASIWTLANQESFRGISERFDMTKSQLHKYLLRICRYLCETNFLHWPDDNNLQQVRREFMELRGRNGFPGVVGVVDGMHIPIPAPTDDAASYYNRKGYHSIILQGICDAECKFIDVFVGWPGATHDGRVWRESPIGRALAQEDLLLPEGTHILGDSAYPLLSYLMVPYRDNGHLSRRQRSYNVKLSSKRVLIEQAFGLLKCRFRRLKFLNMFLTNEMKFVVIAACVLHNVCIINNDYVVVDDDDNANPEYFHEDFEENLHPAGKRDSIANLLYRNLH